MIMNNPIKETETKEPKKAETKEPKKAETPEDKKAETPEDKIKGQWTHYKRLSSDVQGSLNVLIGMAKAYDFDDKKLNEIIGEKFFGPAKG